MIEVGRALMEIQTLSRLNVQFALLVFSIQHSHAETSPAVDYSWLQNEHMYTADSLSDICMSPCINVYYIIQVVVGFVVRGTADFRPVIDSMRLCPLLHSIKSP